MEEPSVMAEGHMKVGRWIYPAKMMSDDSYLVHYPRDNGEWMTYEQAFEIMIAKTRPRKEVNNHE